MEFLEEVLKIENYSLLYFIESLSSIYMKCINKINEIGMSNKIMTGISCNNIVSARKYLDWEAGSDTTGLVDVAMLSATLLTT